MGLSPLFLAAQAALAASHVEQLRRFLDALEAQVPRDDNLCGRVLRRNLQQENQHSESPERADPVFYAAFLRDLCEPPYDLGDRAQLEDRYKRVCAQHALKGPPVQSRPSVLLRYMPAYSFMKKIVSQLDECPSGYARELQRLVTEASLDVSRWSRVLSFIQQKKVWDAIPKRPILLCLQAAMFVTFEGDMVLDRQNSGRVRSALALWYSEPAQPLLEAALEPPCEPSDLKIPTVADAGWYRWFQSVPVGAPHGMTGPRDKALPAQPEAVIAPCTLASVTSPHRLRLLDP